MRPTASSPRASPSSSGAPFSSILQSGERWAELSGRLRHAAGERGDLPAVGDWVAIADPEGAERALVQAVLPRRTKFSRLAASDHGRTVEQVVAANVDVVFLTAGLDGDFNVAPPRAVPDPGWESGASPVVVLTKTDLCADVDAALLEVGSVALGVPVHPVSNVTGEGVDALAQYFGEGRTVAALGSSGVGKSSLVNRLAGEELMATGDLRADGRGRHTTTHRQLLLLPGGGLYLDTPGNAGAAALGVGGGARDCIRRRGCGRCAVPLRRLLARA